MKVVFMGTPQAAVPTIQGIVKAGHEILAVYTQPDRPSGRGNRVIFSPVKMFAMENQFNVIQPVKIRTPEALKEFQELGADVAVVVAYGRILPSEFLSAYPAGAVNVHFSLLPKYRGAAPVNWALVNGETETGVTTMKMDAGLDTGPILRQRSTPILPDETSEELTQRLAVVGAELLLETLTDLDTIVPSPQPESLATLAPILKREDGRIDWTMTAGNICNRVRGFQPFPTAFTTLRGQKLTLWRASEDTTLHSEGGPPGTVIAKDGRRIAIASGQKTVVSIQELQLEGKRRLATQDFLNGISLPVGENLGK
jgi:methionyl-tRNA formyltransferase